MLPTRRSGARSPTSREMTADLDEPEKVRGSFLKQVRANLVAADWKVFSYMVLNFFSSSGIVVTNKYVMDHFGFVYATTLTTIHFICTFLCLMVAALLGFYTPKKLPLGPTAKLAASSMGFVLLTNLSLRYNSVGFYQIAKVMTTPTVVLIEAVVYKKFLEPKLRLALSPVIVGVMLTASTDFRLNLVGALYAAAGVLVTSFYQIWSGTLQKGLDANALQLQTYTAPLSALFILPFVPLFDNYNPHDEKSILHYEFNTNNLTAILITGLLAFLVNISIFLVIGKSSALTYNILGHAKTCLIILSDFVLFGRPFDLKNVGGVLVAMSGVVWYTHLKLEMTRIEKEMSKQESKAEPGGEKIELKEPESDPPAK